MAKWEIKEQEDGSAEVFKNRRWVSNHLDTEIASHFVRQNIEHGDTVIHQAPDGYRTQQGRRRGWRQ